MIQGCPDDDLFAKDLHLRVNGLNPTVYAAYLHDLLGRDMLVKPDTLNCDFFTLVHPLPNLAKPTSSHDALGALKFALDHQLRGQYPPVCA